MNRIKTKNPFQKKGFLKMMILTYQDSERSIECRFLTATEPMFIRNRITPTNGKVRPITEKNCQPEFIITSFIFEVEQPKRAGSI